APACIQRVRNWTRWIPPTESREVSRTRLGWPSSEFICLHAGNMGQKQGLSNLLEAARLLERDKIRIVLAGDGNDREPLMLRARQLRVSNVSFMDVQAQGDFESMLSAADLLLLNQRPSVDAMALPSKLASYFASGRPVVAAVAAQ